MSNRTLLRQLPDNWQEKMLALYSEGMSDYEVMTELRLHYNTFTRFMAEPEFAEVVQFGRQCSKAWWERQGRINLCNKEFNASLWNTNVQNRLGWSQKTSTHESDSGFEKALTPEQLDEKIEQLQKKRRLTLVNKEEQA